MHAIIIITKNYHEKNMDIYNGGYYTLGLQQSICSGRQQ
jgi:hypothetical protein